MNKEILKNPPEKYRPVPFWSWNDKLESEEIRRQAELMKEAGIGGYFMHARGGLQTEYMGEEWNNCVETAVGFAEENNMYPWVYDENGWPSGFANGFVNGLGERYQQKFLKYEEGEKHTEHTICNIDGYHFYYEVNPFYVDTLDGDVIKEFIKATHDKYYEKFGKRLSGFFTDEPEAGNGRVPWSLTLPDEYRKEYGEELLPVLNQIFMPEGDYKSTRMKFWRLITKLFSKNYAKQLYDWCDSHGMMLTGHLTGETSMRGQMLPNGACMPHYRYFHIPGIDWLGRNIGTSLIALQVVSVAMQTGRKQVLTESFAMCGHNVSFSGLRRIFEWQAVRGVNLLCQHLEGYSMRGIRKRDYPPAMFYQQPWWDAYENFNTAVSRIGALVAEGKSECDTLLIHPMTTGWICYDNGKSEGLSHYDNELVRVIDEIESKHIELHLGDELIMEEMAKVAGDKLVIGEMSYSTVVLPPHIELFDSTKKLLDEFRANGGKIIDCEDLPENPVVDDGRITYLKRVHDDFDLHYFVNSTEETVTARINVDGVKFDIMSGDEEAFDRNYTFNPFDSLCVIDYRDGRREECVAKQLENPEIDGEWDIVHCSENSVTFDRCDCYFDGELVGENMPVISIQDMACNLRRKVEIRCVFRADIRYIPEDICLVSETPEIFTYIINGKEVGFDDCGSFCDVSFRKMNVSAYLEPGINTIEMICDFVQSEKVYDDFENSPKCQSIRNKHTYDMEIESVYMTGSFAVTTEGEYENLPNNAVRYKGVFVIDKPADKVTLTNIEQQGFPFFCGNMTLSKKIYTDDTDKKFSVHMKGVNAVKINVNGNDVTTVIWNGTDVDLSRYLKAGENDITLTLYNNLRNLLGPHHLEEGESLTVRPVSFFRDKCMWLSWWLTSTPPWNDDYCFVETSVEMK